MNKTIVVLSGGMDSVTLLHKVYREVEEPQENIKAISFNYGQRHNKEIEKAKESCELLNIEHKVVDINNLQELLSGSALTDNIDVPQGHYEDESMKKTVVPNRNSIMANIAIGWAVSLNFDRVALGVHAGDHSIYPDCRPVFIKALSLLAEVSNYNPIEIYTPYLYSDKIGIIKEGIELGVDYKKTHTCYQGLEKACGKCGSCCERILAFDENNMEDPVEYENGWENSLEYVKTLKKSI